MIVQDTQGLTQKPWKKMLTGNKSRNCRFAACVDERFIRAGSSDPAQHPCKKLSILARTLGPIDNLATSKPY